MSPIRPCLVALSLVAGVLLPACRGGGKAKARPPPRSIALVNGEPIVAEDFRRELQAARAEAGDEELPLDPLRKRVLGEMVDRTLLLRDARTRFVQVEPDEVERAFLRLRSEYPGTNFDDLLAKERLSAAGLKTRLRDQLTIEKLFAQYVFPRVSVSDEEVRRYYAEHSAEFEQPEQVHALQVVVKTEEEARAIRNELRRNPSSFAAVAKRSSIAPEGKNGGDLGYFRKDWMPEEFGICFRLGLNQISEVIASPFGFHVFKVIDRKPAGRQSFEQAQTSIRQKLLFERRSDAQREYLAALKRPAQIQVDPVAVDAVTP